MARKKRELSALEQEYKKQRRRVKQLVGRLEKRGYKVPETIIPKQPKRITQKSVQRLEKITSEYIYGHRKTKYVTESGKAVKGTEGVKIERSRSAKKGHETRKVMKQEIERITSDITNLKDTAKQRGYLFPKGYLEDIEKRIQTMTVEDLKKVTEAEILSSKGVMFRDPWTGTVFTGAEGVKIEEYRKDLKETHKLDQTTTSDEATNILNVVQEYIDQWTPSEHWSDWFADAKSKDVNILRNILEGAIEQEGEGAIAERLEDNADILIQLMSKIMYDSGDSEDSDKEPGRSSNNRAVVEFSNILLGRSLTMKESIRLTQLSESGEY